MSGSFDFNAANFSALPTKVGIPTATSTSTLSPSAPFGSAVALKSNRIAVQLRPAGAQASFDAGVRFVLMLSLDDGVNYLPFKTYSAVPGVHSAVPSGATAGVYDVVDVQATRARVDSYAWGTTPNSGNTVGARIYG